MLRNEKNKTIKKCIFFIADGSNETSQSYSYWVVEEQSYYDITHRDTYDGMYSGIRIMSD